MTNTKLLIICLSFLFGCTSENRDYDTNIHPELPDYITELENLTVYSPSVKSPNKIKFVRDHIFRERKNIVFGGILGALTDDRNRVYVVDGGQTTIHVFEENGTYLTSFADRGEGPGEFLEMSFKMVIHSNQLYLYDTELQRLIVFELDSFKPVATIFLNSGARKHVDILNETYLHHFFVVNEHSLLAGFSDEQWFYNAGEERYIRYYEMLLSGDVISDELLKLKTSKHISDGNFWGFTFPYFRESIVDVSQKGHYYSAWTEDFLIKKYDENGNYLQSFYYPFNKTDLKREDLLNQYRNSERHHQLINSSDLPATWPALNDLFIDDKNRLWIATIVEDSDIYEWWILEETGELITRFEWPRNKPIEVVKNSYMYTLETEDDTGLQQIVRYRIEMD